MHHVLQYSTGCSKVAPPTSELTRRVGNSFTQKSEWHGRSGVFPPDIPEVQEHVLCAMCYGGVEVELDWEKDVYMTGGARMILLYCLGLHRARVDKAKHARGEFGAGRISLKESRAPCRTTFPRTGSCTQQPQVRSMQVVTATQNIFYASF